MVHKYDIFNSGAKCSLLEALKKMLPFFYLSVYYRPCSNTLCNERLEYDGGEVALLNMGKFMIPYDILRDFMFHFLMGRYVNV